MDVLDDAVAEGHSGVGPLQSREQLGTGEEKILEVRPRQNCSKSG